MRAARISVIQHPHFSHAFPITRFMHLHKILPFAVLTHTSFAQAQQEPVAPQAATGQAGLPPEVGTLQKALEDIGRETRQTSPPEAQPRKSTETREVKVTKVATRGSGERTTGVTGEMVIRLAPNHTQRSAVAFMEEFAGGIGDMGRGAGWLAAFNSCLHTGHRITDYEFTFKSYGYSDGPSAGMLMAAALLALINGEEVREDTTMTGTINPDGTCGPVGGIPFKMEAAADAGLKRFGYPPGNTIELKEKARSLGLEAREIDDIYEAYEWLTGKPLRRSPEIDMDEMDIPIASNNRLLADLTTTLTDLKTQMERLPSIAQMNERLKKQPGYYSQDTINLRNLLSKFAEDIDIYVKDGQTAAAYINLQRALMTARILEHGWDEISQGNQMLKNEAVIGHCKYRLNRVGEKIEAALRGTLANSESTHPATLLNTLNGAVSLAEAEALQQSARQSIARMGALMIAAEEEFQKSKSSSGSARDAISARLNLFRGAITELYDHANVFLSRAETKAEMTRLSLAMETEAGNAMRFNAASFFNDGRAYAAGASAILAYFESLIIKQIAEQKDVTMSNIRAEFQMREPIFPALQHSNDSSYSVLQQASRKKTPPQMADSLGILGAGIFCYLGSSSLVNKYYCLDPETDKDGAVKFTRRKALGNMLNAARSNCLARAHDTKEALGMLPQSVRFNFQLAEALRDSNSDDDKLAALDGYWRASLICEIAANVARDQKTASENTQK